MDFENIWKILGLKENITLNAAEIKLLVETAFHTGYEYGKKENDESDAARYKWLKESIKRNESISIGRSSRGYYILLHGPMWSDGMRDQKTLEDAFDEWRKNIRE